MPPRQTNNLVSFHRRLCVKQLTSLHGIVPGLLVMVSLSSSVCTSICCPGRKPQSSSHLPIRRISGKYTLYFSLRYACLRTSIFSYTFIRRIFTPLFIVLVFCFFKDPQVQKGILLARFVFYNRW